MTKPYYQTLGVSETATTEDIKKAFKKLAFEHHPDRNKDNEKEAEAKFKEINEAYSVLSDENKRRMYDTGGDGSQMPFNSPAGGFPFNPEDLFSQMFQGFNGHPRREEDPVIPVGLNLKEMLEGIKGKRTRGKVRTHCGTCVGAGEDPTKPSEKCSACNGQGQSVTTNGFFHVSQPCAACKGRKFKYPPCGACVGKGSWIEDKEIELDLPKGLKPGMSFMTRIKNVSRPVRIFINPDFDVTRIKVAPNGNVHKDIEILYPILALGGKIETELLDGTKGSVNIPENCKSTFIKLKGKGLPESPNNQNTFGDLIYEIKLLHPKLNDEQKELMQKLLDTFQKSS